MNKFCIVLNVSLVILIILTISFNPSVNTASVNNLSKSLTTSTLGGIHTEKQIEDNKNSINESLSILENNVTSNVTSANVITDVLETQVGTMSAYGLDCSGCSGRVGAGYNASGNNVRYIDATYGECRIIAADPKYPYGTIIRVKDSKIGTFNAIVLDRGGAIGIGRRYMADLLFTTEAEASDFGLSRNTTFEVLRYGY